MLATEEIFSLSFRNASIRAGVASPNQEIVESPAPWPNHLDTVIYPYHAT